VKIRVTQENIDRANEVLSDGRLCHAMNCPIAQALKEAFPRASFVSVGYGLSVIGDKEFPTPLSCRIFMERYDKKRDPDPFEFEVEIGEHNA
jgi:hypothetical protein